MSKQREDVWGVKINCPSYVGCPLCYGCRNYRSDLEECRDCAKDVKLNICKKDIHKIDLISQMIKKGELRIENKEVNFIDE